MNGGNIKLINMEMLHIEKCEYEKRINYYGQAVLEGYIEEKDYEACKRKIYSGEIVSVEKVKGADTGILFSGFIKNVSICFERGYQVKLVLQGTLAKLDMSLKSRIFQNSQNCLEDIIAKVTEEYHLQYIMSSQHSTQIQHMVVQYEETDWEFLQRIITEVGGCIIPDYKNIYGQFYTGVKESKAETVYSKDFLVNSLYYEYEMKLENGIEQYIEDQFEYVISERKHFELGDVVNFNGKLLYVYRVEGKWEGEELIHYYVLRTKGGFKQLQEPNYHLCGVTLPAMVSKVNYDKVEVTFDTVEAYGSREYDYATVYSSQKGAGWYCMPEKDDSVTITFPTQDPESAYASGAVHLTMGDKDKDTKFIRTPYEKEIRFTKDAVTITNNKGTEIVLSDKDGLIMTSANAINIVAEKDITISSKIERITLQGESGVELKQGNSRVIVNGDVMLIGEQVHMQNVE